MIGHCAALFVENLVMEQADTGECQYHVVFVAGCDDILITDGTARLCDILNAALVSALNVVAEGEEGIGTLVEE